MNVVQCEFIERGDRTRVCSVCGYVYRGAAKTPRRNCGNAVGSTSSKGMRDANISREPTRLLAARRSLCAGCLACPGANPKNSLPCREAEWKARVDTGNCPRFEAAGLGVRPMLARTSEGCPDEVDVMYPIGSGSRWDDGELRYSIRSIVRHFSPLGRIFIVGHRPSWLKDSDRLVFIPAADPFRSLKDANIIAKTILACRSGISRKFLAPSDDQILLRDATPEDFPPLYSGPIGKGGAGDWRKRLVATGKQLERWGLEPRNYDTHSPQIYDSVAFPEVFRRIQWRRSPGVTINTAYFGGLNPANAVRNDQTRHRRRPPRNDIEPWVEGLLSVGYSDAQLCARFKKFLAERFPEKTEFEI